MAMCGGKACSSHNVADCSVDNIDNETATANGNNKVLFEAIELPTALTPTIDIIADNNANNGR